MITSNRKIANVHKFYNKLSRAVRTLFTMGKFPSCQGMIIHLWTNWDPYGKFVHNRMTNGKNGNLRNLLTLYVNMLSAIHWMSRMQNSIVEMVIEQITERRNYSLVMANKGTALNVFAVKMRITSPSTAQGFYE